MSDGADPREYHQALGRMRKDPSPTPTGADVEDWVTQQFKDPKISEYLQSAAEACAGLSTDELDELDTGGVKLRIEALEESVKLQSHYAAILNQYDGGKRICFPSVDAWLDRLKEMKKGRENLDEKSAQAVLLQAAKDALQRLGKQGYGDVGLCDRLSKAIRDVEKVT